MGRQVALQLVYVQFESWTLLGLIQQVFLFEEGFGELSVLAGFLVATGDALGWQGFVDCFEELRGRGHLVELLLCSLEVMQFVLCLTEPWPCIFEVLTIRLGQSLPQFLMALEDRRPALILLISLTIHHMFASDIENISALSLLLFLLKVDADVIDILVPD
jgi:hypothetical protein